MTHDGEHIGKLIDLNVAKDDGKITELIMDEGKMLEIKAGDIAIGPDVIMVPVNYAAHVKDIEEQKVDYWHVYPAARRSKEQLKRQVILSGEC